MIRSQKPNTQCSVGGVAEWLNAPVLKTDVGESLPWVRIPPPPPIISFLLTCLYIKALEEYGCDKIYQEKRSGTTTLGREQLQECLDFVRDGDELVITRIDRICRNVLDLEIIVKELTNKGVSLSATEQPISTKDATSKAFISMLSVFAELETNLRKERQLEGIQRAKELGKYKGRKEQVDASVVQQLKADGVSIKDITNKFNVTKRTIHRKLVA